MLYAPDGDATRDLGWPIPAHMRLTDVEDALGVYSPERPSIPPEPRAAMNRCPLENPPSR